MGNKTPKMRHVQYFNTLITNRPNEKKQYEVIVYDYLLTRYRFMTQIELYDFYLVDYHLFVEVDEEHHFQSDRSVARAKVTESDQKKNVACITKPVSLLRIPWFTVKSGVFDYYVTKCLQVLSKYPIGTLFLASKDIYTNHDMIDGIDPLKIVHLQ